MAKTRNPDDLLLRVRRELARAPRAPERTLLFAGDPRKPVRRITAARLTLPGLGIAVGSVCLAASLYGFWRSHARAPEEASATLLFAGHPALRAVDAPDSELPSTTALAREPAALPPPPPSDALNHTPFSALGADHFIVEVVNTRKTVDVVLSGPASEPSEDSYRALRHELRSTTTGAENPIDPRLIELLHVIAKRTGGTIQVLSAFRAPKSLRDSNYHTRGMAADVRVPGMSAAGVRDLARSLGARGVGYYPTSEFVHVDVREEPFFWTDTSGPGQSQEDQHAAYADTSGRAASEEPPASAGVAPASSPVGAGADAGVTETLAIRRPESN